MTDARMWDHATSVIGEGIEVSTISRPHCPVTAVTVWGRLGARDETHATSGLGHLLEHLVMTVPLAAFDGLNCLEVIERLGGEANASTGRDYIVCWARVPTDLVAPALSALSEAVIAREVPTDVLGSEAAVIREELHEATANPSALVHELAFGAAFPDHPLGRPVGGERERIAAFDGETVSAYWHERLHAGTVGVGLVGSVDHRQVVRDLEHGAIATLPCRDWRRTLEAGARLLPQSNSFRQRTSAPIGYVAMAGPADPFTGTGLDWQQAAMAVLATSSMSVLYRRLRDDLGLAYDVGARCVPFEDAGLWRWWAGTDPREADRLAEEMTDAAERFIAGRFPEVDIDGCVRQAAGMAVLVTESTLDHAFLWGRNHFIGRLDWDPMAYRERLRGSGAQATVAEHAVSLLRDRRVRVVLDGTLEER